MVTKMKQKRKIMKEDVAISNILGTLPNISRITKKI